MFQLIYHFSFHSLQDTKFYEATFLGHVRTLLVLSNALAVIVPCLVLLAASSTLASPTNTSQDYLSHLTTQMRHLKGGIECRLCHSCWRNTQHARLAEMANRLDSRSKRPIGICWSRSFDHDVFGEQHSRSCSSQPMDQPQVF